jgi:DNA-binding transcriptional ArsR family regulator
MSILISSVSSQIIARDTTRTDTIPGAIPRPQTIRASAKLDLSCPFRLVEGFCFQQWRHRSGRVQILGFFVPNDLVATDLNGAIKCTIHSITEARIVRLHAGPSTEDADVEEMVAAARRRQDAILRHWLLNLGTRNALERCAYLVCELFTRLRAAGCGDTDRCFWPFKQTHLGDALSLTSVHVNRTLRALREEGLVEIKDRNLKIPDFARLQQFCDFDAGYLVDKATLHGVCAR